MAVREHGGVWTHVHYPLNGAASTFDCTQNSLNHTTDRQEGAYYSCLVALHTNVLFTLSLFFSSKKRAFASRRDGACTKRQDFRGVERISGHSHHNRLKLRSTPRKSLKQSALPDAKVTIPDGGTQFFYLLLSFPLPPRAACRVCVCCARDPRACRSVTHQRTGLASV